MINTLKRNFGYRIRQLRLNRQLTQQELGDRCHLDERQIRRIERGNQNTTLITLYRLADALDMSLPELVSELLATPD